MNSVTNYIVPCVQANAVYENKYLLGTSMARPAIAKKLVEIARKEGATAICHGATGKGNDQIRFELGIKALAPDLKIIAPWRMTDNWTMQSREDEIEYCKAARHSIFHSLQIPATAVTVTYGTSAMRAWSWRIRPTSQTTIIFLFLAYTPEKAPDEGEYVTMTFEKGVPTSVNGEKMKVSDIIRELKHTWRQSMASVSLIS